MSSILDVQLNKGYVSTGDGARSAYDLDSGELASMLGAYYRKHDPSQVWRMPGRAAFGSAGSGGVKGLALCQFDSGGTDRLLASIGTTVVSATPGATGSFTSLITGLDSSATNFFSCHQDDRWYLSNGYDKNKCLKPDGTVRDMGMATPQVNLLAVASSVAGSSAFPTAWSGVFVNPTFAYDGISTTFSSGSMSTSGTSTHTWKTWAANANPSRSLYVSWALAGLPIASDAGGGIGGTGSIGTGGTIDSGYSATVTLSKSEDSGATFTSFFTTTLTRASGLIATTASILDATNSSAVQFQASIQYNSGTSTATLRIYEVRIQYGSTTTPFDTTGTMYYAYTEYDSLDDNESPPSDLTALAAFTAQNYVTITRDTAVNTSATHWNLYRTVPGAAQTIDNLGFVKSIPIAQTVFYDGFDDAATTQLTPTVPALTVGDLSIPRDTQPPAFLSMVSWNGSICGISRTNRRQWRYSDAGFPESFPEFYVVSSFPLDEHDGLVGQMPVGQTMVLLAEGAVVAVDDTPRVVDGQFNGADARPLKGHPGCVGNYAFTTYSVAGEPHGAWVSPFGVYTTNGQTCYCISTDLAWETEVNRPYLSTAVLRWDPENMILWFEFDKDGDGLNDHEMPFHMAPMHQKQGGTPKLGQPTPKATSCMASGLISAGWYRFSGHPSNGSVYVEESGYQDGATSTNVATTVKTGKLSDKRIDLAILKMTLVHGDFGSGETATLTTTLYRDSAATSAQKANTLSVSGHRGTTCFVGRAGQAVDFQIDYSGTGLAGFLGGQAELDQQGRSGTAQRWVSTSATP